MTTIDVHAHLISPELVGMFQERLPDHAPVLVERSDGIHLEYRSGRTSGPLPAGMRRLDARLEDMDRQEVDLQIISAAPPNFQYEAPPEVGAIFAQVSNDVLLAEARDAGGRLGVFLHLPMQEPAAAVEELVRVGDDRLARGVQIGSNIGGLNLDDQRFEEVWSALTQRDLPVIVHPGAVAGMDRMRSHHLRNLVGNPLDSTIAIASLILGGVLERHPTLRWAFVHGGGFAPYQIGRFDHAWRERADVREHTSIAPSAQLSRLYFDTLTHDLSSLRFLGERVGWDHVLLGSDYLFDMADADPVRSVRALELPAETEDLVLGTNAQSFLRAPA